MKSDSLPLDFTADESLSGFRLQRLEVSHAAVLKAQAQVALLQPLVADGERHAALAAAIDAQRAAREALHA